MPVSKKGGRVRPYPDSKKKLMGKKKIMGKKK